MQFKKDRMGSVERIKAMLNRQPVDRVPFFSFAQGFSTLNVGYPIADYYRDPERSVYALKKTEEQYNYAPITLYGYAAFCAWEFGGELKWPEGEFSQAPATTRYPVNSLEEIDSLEIPKIEEAGGFIPLFTQFSEIHEKYPGYYLIGIEAPFVGSGNICGVTNLTRWIIKAPEAVHKILRKVTDFKIELVRYLAKKFGTEKMLPWVGDATASNVIISPKMFQEFAMPYTKELHENILDAGYKHIVAHICGEQTKNYPYWAQIPMGDPGLISVSHEVDLNTAIKYFPNDIILGNINPSVIQAGTADEVYGLAVECLKKGMKAPAGFMLAPGCELPAKAPPYNVWTCMKAIDDFGWYE